MPSERRFEDRIRASAPAVRPWELQDLLLRAARRRLRRRYGRLVGLTVMIATAVAVVAIALPGSKSHSTVNVGAPGTTRVRVPGGRPPGVKREAGGPGATVAQLAAGKWAELPQAPIPPRQGVSVVWTGTELLVWGGASGPHGGTLHADGAAYTPSTGTWRRLPAAPISGRTGQSAVWTGSEMVIWGGYDRVGATSSLATNTGAAYNPRTDSWHVLPAAPLSSRVYALVAWTGRRVLLLGGQPAILTSTRRGYGDGALFDPSTGSWTHLDAPPAPSGHGLDWSVGAQVDGRYLAWSDWSTTKNLGHGSFSSAGGNDLYSYSEYTNSWHFEPLARYAVPGVADVVATNDSVVARGSSINCGDCSPPYTPEITAIYQPTTDSWSPLPPDPIAGDSLRSAWTGEALFSFDTAASAYSPTSARWTRLRSAPSSCDNDSDPVWTGKEILMYCPRPASGPGARHDGLAFTPRT